MWSLLRVLRDPTLPLCLKQHHGKPQTGANSENIVSEAAADTKPKHNPYPVNQRSYMTRSTWEAAIHLSVGVDGGITEWVVPVTMGTMRIPSACCAIRGPRFVATFP